MQAKTLLSSEKSRRQPAKDRLLFEAFPSPIGNIYLIFSGGGEKDLAGITMEKPKGIKAGPAPDSFKKQMRSYFKGELRAFEQSIVFLEGTDFEKKVWLSLKDVPYGQTRTYKWLSEHIGRPGAYRAVGQALSKNPIPIVFPCHRIIESDGHIGGYSSGANIKRRLLDMEYYFSER